jgi:hypothetical protein
MVRYGTIPILKYKISYCEEGICMYVRVFLPVPYTHLSEPILSIAWKRDFSFLSVFKLKSQHVPILLAVLCLLYILTVEQKKYQYPLISHSGSKSKMILEACGIGYDSGLLIQCGTL